MATTKIKKIETKKTENIKEPKEKVSLSVSEEKDTTQNSEKSTVMGTKRTKRVCSFCAQEKEPSFTDSAALKKFMSDRFRIIPRAKSGVCSKHQRKVTQAIKHARHLALLPFVASV